MGKLILIPAGQTDWRTQGRLAGDMDLPLTELGHRQAVATGQEITKLAPALIRSGPEQNTKQTASLIAHQANLRLRTVKDLREMSLGHWQGLTLEDFEERFGKVYRQWRADPLSIEPPDGETVADSAARLAAAIEKIQKKRPDDVIAVVVGNYAFAILRCRLIDNSYEDFWTYVDEDQTYKVIGG